MAEQTIITRKEAKHQGLVRYFTGKACKHGHTDFRRTGCGGCVTCCRDRVKALQRTPDGAKNRRARSLALYYRDHEASKEKHRIHYRNNSTAIIDRSIRYKRDQWHVNTKLRLSALLRNRVYRFLRGIARPASCIKALGCNMSELIKHLEAQFEPGMSWDNHRHDVWHIDHIKPLAMFDLSDPDQYAEACHFTNLRPLWASQNMSKGAKYDTDGCLRP